MLRNLGLLLLAGLLCASCSATAGWFHQAATQRTVTEGCKALQADDNVANAAMNAIVPYPEVRAAINTAHMAIQAALQKCIDRVPGAPAIP